MNMEKDVRVRLFVSLTQTWIAWVKGISIEKMPSLDWPVRKVLEGIFLISD